MYDDKVSKRNDSDAQDAFHVKRKHNWIQKSTPMFVHVNINSDTVIYFSLKLLVINCTGIISFQAVENAH